LQKLYFEIYNKILKLKYLQKNFILLKNITNKFKQIKKKLCNKKIIDQKESLKKIFGLFKELIKSNKYNNKILKYKYFILFLQITKKLKQIISRKHKFLEEKNKNIIKKYFTLFINIIKPLIEMKKEYSIKIYYQNNNFNIIKFNTLEDCNNYIKKFKIIGDTLYIDCENLNKIVKIEIYFNNEIIKLYNKIHIYNRQLCVCGIYGNIPCQCDEHVVSKFNNSRESDVIPTQYELKKNGYFYCNICSKFKCRCY